MARGKAHDNLFRKVFGEPERSKELLRCLMPPALVAMAVWNKLDRVSGEFVSAKLEERATDLLWRLPIRGQRLPLYVLLEHQSKCKKRMVLKVSRYMLGVWDDWSTEHRRAPRLPPIVAVVVSHDERGWRSPTRLRDLVAAKPALATALGSKLADLDFFSEDLRQRPDREILGWPMHAEGKATLLMLKHVRGSLELRKQLREWTDLFLQILQGPGGEPAFATLVWYVLQVSGKVTVEQLAEDFSEALGTRAGEVVMTEAQRLIAKGKQQGLEQALVRIFERRLQRKLGDAEQATLRQRLTHLGPDRLGDVVLDLSSEELAVWLANPRAE